MERVGGEMAHYVMICLEIEEKMGFFRSIAQSLAQPIHFSSGQLMESWAIVTSDC